MADSVEIQNLLTNEEYDMSVHQYSDSQIKSIDAFNTSFTSGQVNFNTPNIRDQWIVWRDAYLALPLNITSSGTAYTAATLLAFKQSLLDLIWGVNVTCSGQQLVSDTNINIINNIRLLIEKDMDWFTEESFGLLFEKDSAALSSTTMGVSNPTAAASSNPGFTKRIGLLKQVASGTSTWSFVANIPLRYIHDIFDKLDFPMINHDFIFTFLTNFYTNNLSPMVVDSAAAPSAPVITIGAATDLNGVTIDKPRLYYKSVKFMPELASRLEEKLRSGYTKRINYRCTDAYYGATGVDTAQTGGTVNRLVTPSVVHPLRLIFCGTPAGGLTGSTALATYPASFTNFQVKVSTNPFFETPIQTSEEMYELLQEQFPGAGSSNTKGGLISKSEFLSAYRFHVCDLTRLKERLANPNKDVSITVSATRVNNMSCDYHYILEKLMTVNLTFGDAGVKVLVGAPAA